MGANLKTRIEKRGGTVTGVLAKKEGRGELKRRFNPPMKHNEHFHHDWDGQHDMEPCLCVYGL
jgi:hypothetical protein